ncbi:MAG: PKD domain-containing protein [Bacteroidia bacterium]
MGVVTATNSDATVSGRICIYGLFGTQGTYTTWSANVELLLKKQCTNPTRVPLVVTVNPRPIGADVVKGSTFEGQFRVGDVTTPDITEVGNTIIYELAPPTGFSYNDHASTWVINGVQATTRYGAVVDPADYTVAYPFNGSAATITYVPQTKYLDSFITFALTYSDLGPHYCDSTVTRTVVIAPTPWPDFKFPSSICLGDVILFDNTTVIHSGNANYMWYFGDGDSSDSKSPVHEYKNTGVYQVKLVATSFPWNVVHDTTIQVEVGEVPTTRFRANNKCEGIAVNFQNQTTIGNGVLTYDWDFGDNSPHSTATNPSHLYAAPGGYKVTLTASANGCVSKLVKNAYTFARPVPNFAAPLAPVCAKSEVSMPNTSTIALGSQGAYWSFGDGGNSTLFDGNHTYETPGTYAVKLLAVSEFDCRDSITKNVTIKPTPNPEFSGDQFCGKIPTVFTNTTFEVLPNPVYTWNFSDGFNSTQKNITRTWPYEGPFNVSLKAEYSNGCVATESKVVTVLIQPQADFTVQDICSGENANFVNLSKGDIGNIQYNWDFGNGTNSTLGTPIRLYNPTTTTTYTVSLVASYIGGCSDTTSKTITVSEAPICDFNYKELGFNEASFTPSNSSYSKYEWFFGEGGTSLQTSPTYQYLYSGNFNVTMKATNAAGCDCEITKRISATTGIETIANNNGVRIYPNPNSGTFNVTNEANNPMSIEVFNVIGEKVFAKNTNEGSTTIQLNNHAKGIYMVKVTINGVTSTSKITVTN